MFTISIISFFLRTGIFSWVSLPSRLSCLHNRNETETKTVLNCFASVSFQFHLNWADSFRPDWKIAHDWVQRKFSRRTLWSLDTSFEFERAAGALPRPQRCCIYRVAKKK